MLDWTTEYPTCCLSIRESLGKTLKMLTALHHPHLTHQELPQVNLAIFFLCKVILGRWLQTLSSTAAERHRLLQVEKLVKKKKILRNCTKCFLLAYPPLTKKWFLFPHYGILFFYLCCSQNTVWWQVENGWGWMRTGWSEVNVVQVWFGFPGSLPMHTEVLKRSVWTPASRGGGEHVSRGTKVLSNKLY